VFFELDHGTQYSRAGGDPNKKDPMSYRYLNQNHTSQPNVTAQKQAIEESIDKEYHNLGSGVVVPRKVAARPAYQMDNGKLTDWDKGE
jgi:hypothetical protein